MKKELNFKMNDDLKETLRQIYFINLIVQDENINEKTQNHFKKVREQLKEHFKMEFKKINKDFIKDYRELMKDNKEE